MSWLAFGLIVAVAGIAVANQSPMLLCFLAVCCAGRLVYYTVKLNVTVIGSRKQLFAYLADFTTNAEWDPNTREAKRLSGDPRNPTKGDVFELITLFKGSASKMHYELQQAESDSGTDGAVSRITLIGESEMAKARDVITLTDAGVGADGLPRTTVDYQLTLSLKGWRRPFIRLIGSDLENLGAESIAGLVSTCEARTKRMSS